MDDTICLGTELCNCQDCETKRVAEQVFEKHKRLEENGVLDLLYASTLCPRCGKRPLGDAHTKYCGNRMYRLLSGRKKESLENLNAKGIHQEGDSWKGWIEIN